MRNTISAIVIASIGFGVGNYQGKKSVRKQTENENYKVAISDNGSPFLYDKKGDETFYINFVQGQPIVRDLGYNANIIGQVVSRMPEVKTHVQVVNNQQDQKTIETVVEKIGNVYDQFTK